MTGSARRPSGWTQTVTVAVATSALECVQLVNDLGTACLADASPAPVVPAVETAPRRRSPLAALPAQWLACAVQLVMPSAGPATGQVITVHQALGVALVALFAALPAERAGSAVLRGGGPATLGAEAEESRFAGRTLDHPGTLGPTDPGTSGPLMGSRSRQQGGEAMKPIQQAIEVRVPVHTAYEQLAQFECYPQFMTGVQEVRKVSDTTTHWVMDLDGRRTEFDAQITDCRLDERVAWKATGAQSFSEAITLKALAADRTQVTVELEADAQALLPSDKHAKDALRRRLKADLNGFKRYVEQQGEAAVPAPSPALLGRGAKGMHTQGRAASGRSTQSDAELELREGSAEI